MLTVLYLLQESVHDFLCLRLKKGLLLIKTCSKKINPLYVKVFEQKVGGIDFRVVKTMFLFLLIEPVLHIYMTTQFPKEKKLARFVKCK